MSETFDAALRDAYDRTAALPEARLDAAIPLMVARTRRTRRFRAAGTAVATAAAVVGVAIAGVAMAGRGTETVPPATTPSVAGTVTEPACGTALTDLAALPADSGVQLVLGLDAAEVPQGVDLTGWLGTTVLPAGMSFRAEIPSDYAFAVVQDGVVVATTDARVLATQRALPEGASHDAAVTPISCADSGPLVPGEYALAAYLPVEMEDDGARLVLVSEPVPFVVTGTSSLPNGDRVGADGISDAPPDDPSAPLPDGIYLALDPVVDADGGVEADLQVWYSGAAAEAWLATNEPGAELTNDYVLVDPDGPATRRLPLATGVPVWEWCSGDGRIQQVQRAGGLAEWAAAPSDGMATACTLGADLSRGHLYWLDVRGGVVAQVVGQYVP